MKQYHLYNDQVLLDLLAEDDELAFTEIYHRYWKALFAIASSRLQNALLAEDILHDVFASLWNNRYKIKINSLQNYLSSATRYLVFAAIRKNVHDRRYRAAQTDNTQTEFNIENALHNKRLLEFVNREMELLPEKCRLVFKYSREKGMTNKEIAAEMKITLKTVENQMNKALHHLRFSMKKILQVFI